MRLCLSLYIILDYSLSFSLLAKQVEQHKREKKPDVFILPSVENFRAFTNKLSVGKRKYIMLGC